MKPHAYKTGAAICIATGVGVVLLTEMSGGSSSLYWTMIMLIFFAASLIMPFKPLQAAAVFGVIALFYDVWIMLHDQTIDSESWVLSNAGIWLSLFVSVIAVVYIDDLRDREDADRYRLELLNLKLRDEITKREKAKSEMRRTQQLEAVGRLAAGMAHELNNVLLVISSSAELIQRKSGQTNAYADRIVESAHRGAQLTSDMLLFAREGHRENKPFSLNQVVESVAEVVSNTQKIVTTVKTVLTAEEPWVSGDRQLISQALLNLCLNSVDSMDTPNALEIRTRIDGQVVHLSVKDRGKGMSAQELEQAFEPFFTTKPPGKGTGLGLSMVYGTIKDHGGSIVLDSALNKGTTVHVELPIADSMSATETSTPVPLDTPGEEARILLVDDNEMVRSIMKENLETSGFTVHEASDGGEACQKFSAHNAQFDLIILDVVMPIMSGSKAYEYIRAKSETQRILMYSGNALDQELGRRLDHPHTQFLQKPFLQNELLDTVTQLLKD